MATHCSCAFLIADADDVDLNSDEVLEWIEALWTAEGRILTVDETTTALLPRAVARAIGLPALLTVVAGPPLVQADHASVGRVVPKGFTHSRIRTECARAREARNAIAALTDHEVWELLIAIGEKLRGVTLDNSNTRGRDDPVVRVQAECYALLFPSEAFGEEGGSASKDSKKRRSHWDRFMHRYNRLRAAHGDVERHLTLRFDAKFRYTPREATFCARFDALGKKWEERQRDITVGSMPAPCAVCDELRPLFMQNMRCPDEKFLGLHPNFERYRGTTLCYRCRSPKKDEVQAGTLRFSKENSAFPLLKELHCAGATPFYEATEGEIALVRLTNPCIVIKMLNHGGTLSSSHSVRCSAPRPPFAPSRPTSRISCFGPRRSADVRAQLRDQSPWAPASRSSALASTCDDDVATAPRDESGSVPMDVCSMCESGETSGDDDNSLA